MDFMKIILINVPVFGQKRIFHHFSNQYTICEKFDCGHTLWNKVDVNRVIGQVNQEISIFQFGTQISIFSLLILLKFEISNQQRETVGR
jgi:hypothetical protein